MSKARGLAYSGHNDGGLSINEDVFESNLTIDANMNGSLSGPVTVPNLYVNGTLNVMSELNVTTNLEVGTNGTLNVIG
jgi:hypothetical protein